MNRNDELTTKRSWRGSVIGLLVFIIVLAGAGYAVNSIRKTNEAAKQEQERVNHDLQEKQKRLYGP